MEKWSEFRNEGDGMMHYTRYFDFDMLNKHYNEYLEQFYGIIWLAIYFTIIYTAIKLFLKWDN